MLEANSWYWQIYIDDLDKENDVHVALRTLQTFKYAARSEERLEHVPRRN